MGEINVDLASWLDDMTSVDVQPEGGTAQTSAKNSPDQGQQVAEGQQSSGETIGQQQANTGAGQPTVKDGVGEGNAEDQSATEGVPGEQDKQDKGQQQQPQVELYSDDELAQLLEFEPDKIDFEKVPANVRSVVKVMANKAVGEQQQGTISQEYQAVQQQAEALREEAHARAVQEIEQRFGAYDPTDPQQVALLTRAVSEGDRLASNLVRAFEMVSTLKQQEPRFDQIMVEVERKAKSSPLYRRAWDEADVEVLKPLYDQVRQRFYSAGRGSTNAQSQGDGQQQVKEGLQSITKGNPPDVEKPGNGQPAPSQKFSPGDFAFLDEREQAQALIELGLVD